MTHGSSVAQLVFEGTITFANVVAGTTAAQTVAHGSNLGGNTLLANAAVILNLPNLQAGLIFSNPFVTSAGSLTVTFQNTTGGDLVPLGTAAKLVQP